MGTLQLEAADITVVEVGNGTYTITIFTTRAATYTLRVYVEGALAAPLVQAVTYLPGAHIAAPGVVRAVARSHRILMVVLQPCMQALPLAPTRSWSARCRRRS